MPYLLRVIVTVCFCWFTFEHGCVIVFSTKQFYNVRSIQDFAVTVLHRRQDSKTQLESCARWRSRPGPIKFVFTALVGLTFSHDGGSNFVTVNNCNADYLTR